jgi:hypothetical protein
MSRKTQLRLVPDRRTSPKPPSTLGEAGLDLWRKVMAEYAITDVGGVEILAQACAAADRAAALARQIEKDGEIVETKAGPKDHPGLKHELACRSFVVRALLRLGLDVEPVRPTPGRPGRPVSWMPEESA